MAFGKINIIVIEVSSGHEMKLKTSFLKDFWDQGPQLVGKGWELPAGAVKLTGVVSCLTVGWLDRFCSGTGASVLSHYFFFSPLVYLSFIFLSIPVQCWNLEGYDLIRCLPQRILGHWLNCIFLQQIPHLLN